MKRKNVENTQTSKARIALDKEMEEAGKTHKAIKVKQQKQKKEEEILNEKEQQKIIKSAHKQLKEDKMEEEMEKRKFEIENNENMMELEDLEFDDELEDLDQLDEDDELIQTNGEFYDVQIDQETQKLLSAFSQENTISDLNEMIRQQHQLMREEELSKKRNEKNINDLRNDNNQNFLNNNNEMKDNLNEGMMQMKKQTEKVFPQKVKQIFTELGVFLSHYKIGKLPKVFKLLPSYEDWIPLLQMTNPSQWTPQSLFAATKLFIHTNNQECEQFIRVFLYPIMRHSIQQNKKLHFNEYLAIKRCIYRPVAFFKGVIFPLCQEKNVTLKEAAIICSILSKISIPPNHSAVALYKLSQMEYNSTMSMVLKTLIDKKYKLPKSAIFSLHSYYVGFAKQQQNPPLLWHQGLLIYVKRYGSALDQKQLMELLNLGRKHKHHAITPLMLAEIDKYKNALNANKTFGVSF